MPLLALHHLLGAVAAIPTMQSFRVGEAPTLGAPQNYEVGLLSWKWTWVLTKPFCIA